MNQNQAGTLARPLNSPPPPEAVRLGQVDIWLNNARQTVEENEMHVSSLESRLLGITIPSDGPMVNASIKEAPQETLVPTADIIRNITQRLDATNNRLRSLLGRIEL